MILMTPIRSIKDPAIQVTPNHPLATTWEFQLSRTETEKCTIRLLKKAFLTPLFCLFGNQQKRKKEFKRCFHESWIEMENNKPYEDAVKLRVGPRLLR
jgi:hypothetical protein